MMMTEIIGVRFRDAGKLYYFDPAGKHIKKGETVIVETARGIENAEVYLGNTAINDENVVKPLRHVIRIATNEDFKTIEDNAKKEKEAHKICCQKIETHKLDMKLTNVEYTFDSSKIVFYFTSDGRVDFRELVKDLATEFKARIELRQIGVRDEAKMINGIGICGQGLCCARFLGDFQPVSIKMAKEQGLSLNPTKISGACGRLMCCLKYEQNMYEELSKETPSQGTVVKTLEGKGVVVDSNLLTGKVKVKLDNFSESPPMTYDKDKIKILHKSRNIKKDDIEEDIPKELLE